MIRIGITGASGFIGKELCNKLLKLNYKLNVVIRSSSNFDIKNDNLQICKIDKIGPNTNWKEFLKDIDLIIHCAAQNNDKNLLTKKDKELFHSVNVLGTENLIKQAAKFKIKRIIYLSTAKVHGETTKDYKKFKYDSDFKPYDLYSRSKLETEIIIKKYSKLFGFEYVIIRPPLVYGKGVKGSFLKLLNLLSINISLPIPLVNNQRSYLYLENLIDFIIQSISHEKAHNKVFLLSDNNDLSFIDLIKKISSVMNKKNYFIYIPPFILKSIFLIFRRRKIYDSLFSSFALDVNNTYDALGWTPPYSLDYALKETVEWYLKNHETTL